MKNLNNMMSLNTSVFQTSVARIHASEFWRTNGWTTNGFWMLKSIFEPKFLTRLAHKPREIALKDIEKVIEPSKRAVLRVHGVNDVRTSWQNSFFVRMTRDNENRKEYTSWINAHFLRMFEKAFDKVAYKIYQEKPETPFYFINPLDEKRNVLGVIMPIRYEDFFPDEIGLETKP